MKQQHHSAAFREQALLKVFARNGRPIAAVASDLGLSIETLKGWMRQARALGRKGASGSDVASSDHESLAGRLELLMASAGLSGDALQAWCRERGIYAHQLATWKATFALGADAAAVKPLRQERDSLKQELDRLQRQLLRKDKALAEAAALLVLSKKFQALLAGEVE